MEAFDMKLFKEKQENNFYEYSEDDKYVTLADLGDVYRKTTRIRNSALEEHISYYKNELTVMGSYRMLYDVYIGVINYYDIYGNLEKERDMDAPFAYSVYYLGNWINEKYDINIFEKKQSYMVSRSENPYPHYMIRFTSNDGRHIMYSINGSNGEIIYQKIDGNGEEVNPAPKSNEQRY